MSRRPSAIDAFAAQSCLLLAVVVSVGCSDSGAEKPTARLQGTITIGGQSIPDDADANITFRPTVTGQARMTTVPVVDGKYDAPEVPIGSVKVFISVQQPTGRLISEEGVPENPEYRNLVPSELGTGIPLEVAADKADQDFSL